MPNRREALLVLPLLVANGILELLGVGSVLPFVAAVTEPQSFQQNRLLSYLYTTLDPASYEQFLAFLFVGTSVMFASVNLLGAATEWVRTKFAHNARYAISSKLLESFLSRSYCWYLQQNSSELSKDLLSEVDTFTKEVLIKSAEFINCIFRSSFIFAGLLYLDFKVAISTVFALAVIYQTVFRFLRTRIKAIGVKRAEANALRFKAATEAFSVVREARLFHRRPYLKQRFDQPAKHLCDTEATHKLITNLPRYVIETVAIVTLFGLTVLLIVNEHPSALALVALYITAIWRLVPALQDIYKTRAIIKFYRPIIGKLHSQMSGSFEEGWAMAERVEPLTWEQTLTLKSANFTYAESDRPALSGIELTIRKGDVVAFVGRTGEGKTTLVDVLAGYLPLSSGTLLIDGKQTDAGTLAAWRLNIGMVPQDIFLIDDTVTRNIALGVPDKAIDQQRVSQVAKLAQIDEFVTEQLSQGYDTVLGERGVNLSGGQRQRIGIARALYEEPELLILDESTNALDSLTETSLLRAVRESQEGKTIILITHRINSLKECDAIYLLDDGKILASGTYTELKEHHALFQELSRESE